MSETRVPMPTRTHWLDDDAVRLSSATNGQRVGRRFSMDVSEAMLAQIGARGLEHAVERLGTEVAYAHLADIQSAVDRALRDENWVKPIIEDEIRRTVREWVRALWSDKE